MQSTDIESGSTGITPSETLDPVEIHNAVKSLAVQVLDEFRPENRSKPPPDKAFILQKAQESFRNISGVDAKCLDGMATSIAQGLVGSTPHQALVANTIYFAGEITTQAMYIYKNFEIIGLFTVSGVHTSQIILHHN